MRIPADISLLGSHVDAGGEISLTLFDQDSVDLHARSNTGARVFVVLEDKVPLANARFGASRSRVRALFSDAEPNLRTGYYPDEDILRYGAPEVWDRPDGYAIILHEYGHAYHWRAIEAPRAYECPGGRHFEHIVSNSSCALVEGFAEFFAAWIGGERLVAGRGTDNLFESNEYRLVSSTEGYRLEGAVAGFLYDLVDNAGSPDSPFNTADGDDDPVSYSGIDVRTVLRTCQVRHITLVIFHNLIGIDEFIFCAENSLTAQTLINPANPPNHYFGAAELINIWVDPHGMNPINVRGLWLCNLYNQGC
ncbi:MAG: hypothetical protein ACREMA_02035 [Longimicrobiales bacterium]